MSQSESSYDLEVKKPNLPDWKAAHEEELQTPAMENADRETSVARRTLPTSDLQRSVTLPATRSVLPAYTASRTGTMSTTRKDCVFCGSLLPGRRPSPRRRPSWRGRCTKK